jgi:hypothetical protein
MNDRIAYWMTHQIEGVTVRIPYPECTLGFVEPTRAELTRMIEVMKNSGGNCEWT